MSMSRHLKQLGRKFLQRHGYELYRRPWLPKGVDPFETLRAGWPAWQPHIVFDVGANIGQTVKRVRTVFPAAQIHSFEPVPATFAVLKAAVARMPFVQAHCLALADRAGEMQIAPQSDSTLNSLNFTPAAATSGGVRVELQTTTAFCTAHGIAHIDLLKIDVEGTELAVLRGAAPLLTASAVDFILVEAGLMPGEPRFTPLPALIEFLQPHGFWLVGIYDQHGWHRSHAAEFCNALFAHDRQLTAGATAPGRS